jgi:hypothetical protein
MLIFMPWLVMAPMVALSRSRPFEVLPVTRLSLLDATPLVPSENPFPRDRNGADGTSLWAGPFRGSTCLRLPASDHHQPFCLPLFSSDGLHVYLYALTAHFGEWLEGRRGRKARQWQVAAGLIYGQMKKSYRRRKLVGVTPVMRLGTGAALTVARPRTGSFWTAKHCLY